MREFYELHAHQFRQNHYFTHRKLPKLIMSYQPGVHLIATLHTGEVNLIQRYERFQQLINDQIQAHQLTKLGEVYHNFEPAGFTAVVCLSESHLSIHTWPEYGKINVDIYLSNFLRTNDGTVYSIYQSIKEHFSGAVENEQFLTR